MGTISLLLSCYLFLILDFIVFSKIKLLIIYKFWIIPPKISAVKILLYFDLKLAASTAHSFLVVNTMLWWRYDDITLHNLTQHIHRSVWLGLPTTYHINNNNNNNSNNNINNNNTITVRYSMTCLCNDIHMWHRRRQYCFWLVTC